MLGILLALIISGVVSVFLYITSQIYKLREKYKHIPGPPTKGIAGFYLGNLAEVVKTVNSGKIICDLQIEWIEKYGNVIKYQLFNKIIILTVEPSAVKDVLITRNFKKIAIVYDMVGFPLNERFMGNGMATERDKEKWKHKRAGFNHNFFRQSLVNYMEEFNHRGDLLIERLRGLADTKKTVSLFKEVNHAAFDVIANVALGMNVDSINNPDNKLNYYVSQTMIRLDKVLTDPFIYFKPGQWGFILSFKNILRTLRKIGKDEIENRIKSLAEGHNVSNDMLSSYLVHNKEKDTIDLEELVDEFVTFFVGGQETSANSMAFTLQALSQHPEVLQKMRDELDRVLGSRSEVRNEDLIELKYTGCVIKESLRLWPPVGMISRETDEDSPFSINGYDIPKSSWIQVATYISSRLEQFYPDAKKFLPERHLKEENQENYQSYSSFPFSLGPRNCIGQNFAQMEMKVMLAKIVKNFDIHLDQNQNFGLKQESTLRPAGGTICTLSLRSF